MMRIHLQTPVMKMKLNMNYDRLDKEHHHPVRVTHHHPTEGWLRLNMNNASMTHLYNGNIYILKN